MCREAAAQRGAEALQMARDRSLVRRVGAQAGRNSDVDKPSAVWWSSRAMDSARVVQ